jgi:hypothetical protein
MESKPMTIQEIHSLIDETTLFPDKLEDLNNNPIVVDNDILRIKFNRDDFGGLLADMEPDNVYQNLDKMVERLINNDPQQIFNK